MLTFSTFGCCSVSTGDRPIRFNVGPEGRSFAAYLFSNPNRILRREKMLANFWPDAQETEAKKRLNNTLSSLRQAISRNTRSDPNRIIHSTHEEIMVRQADDIVIDSVYLRTNVTVEWEMAESGNRVLPKSRVKALIDALASYRGHFLEECDATWLYRDRNQYFQLFIRGRILLLRHFFGVGNFEQAIEQAVELLAWDDSREMVLRDLMRLYVLNDQRAQAVLCYQRFVENLKNEHGLEPMPVTKDLLVEIIDSDEMTLLETYTREISGY